MDDIPSVEELDSSEPLINYGNSLTFENKHGEAIAYFQKALSLDDTPFSQFQSHLGLGDCYRNMGDFITAKKHFQTALDLNEFPLVAMFQLAQIAFLQNDDETGHDYLLRIIQLFPQIPLDQGYKGIYWAINLMNEVGSYCLDQDMPERARDFFKQILTVPIEDTQFENAKRDSRFKLAIALNRLGKEDVAIEHLEQLVVQDDGDMKFVDYKRYLALTYAETGQYEKSIDMMQQALATARSSFHYHLEIDVENKEFYRDMQNELSEIQERANVESRVTTVEQGPEAQDITLCHITGCNREAQVRCVNCGKFACSLHAQHDVTMRRGAFGAPGRDKHFSTICDECVPLVRQKMKDEAKAAWVLMTIFILTILGGLCGGCLWLMSVLGSG